MLGFFPELEWRKNIERVIMYKVFIMIILNGWPGKRFEYP